MLKSFCIKTNNNKIVNYLLTEFQNAKIDNMYISNLKFKFYNNVIVHYKGKDLNCFYNVFSNVLSSAVLNFYEENLIKHLMNNNYFYFTEIEQEKIISIINEYLSDNDFSEVAIRKSSIEVSCIEYFSNNKSAILDGFVNFRLNEYIKILDYIVDLGVNKFIIDREYSEFIDLLKCYINSKECNSPLVHLIYKSQESTLLDEFKNIITVDESIFNSKYLSDISFSSNDYTLNTLLTLLPKKIYIHLVDNIEDEFINTLKLIFDNRIYICNDCSLCKIYRLEKMNN